MSTDRKFSEYSHESGRHTALTRHMEGRFEMDIPLISQEALCNHVTRCLENGIPFCHTVACPLNNIISDLCDSMYKSQWHKACDLLHSVNNFPEITGRICPAPCEITCSQNAQKEGVPIRQMEYQIAEYGFANDWIKPARIETKSGKRVVVIGSGPAGLAAAQQLVRLGHEVIVFEKDELVGGYLRYGIPDFKLPRTVLDRRLNQLIEEGVRFVTGITVGQDISHSYLGKMCDAICVAVETGPPRDLSLPGRQLENVIFATEYLRQVNQAHSGQRTDLKPSYSVKDKVVAVIGGGTTGHDCVVAARRDGAGKIYQFEIKPSEMEPLSHDTNHAFMDDSCRDNCIRRWCVQTKSLSGIDGKVDQLHGIEVQWLGGQHGFQMQEVPGTEFTLPVDMVLLAIGFEHVSDDSIVKELGFRSDSVGNLIIDPNSLTSQVGLFTTGDATMGTPLVGRAIACGRRVATQIGRYLITHEACK